MQKELRNAIDQTRDVEGQIRSALQTPMKRDILWIVTESDYDRGVYECFFNDKVAVRPSYDEKGKGGCDRVVRIVKNILKSGDTKRIVGLLSGLIAYLDQCPRVTRQRKLERKNMWR